MSDIALDSDMADLILDFIAESRDMLDEVEPTIIELDSYRDDNGKVDEEIVASIFRLFHSLKGSAGFLQFDVIVKVTHRAETLLDLIRKGKADLLSSHMDVLCRACDLIRELLDAVETTGTDGEHAAAGKQMEDELARTIDEASVGTVAVAKSQDKKPPQIAEAPSQNTPKPEPAASVEPAEFTLKIGPELMRQFVEEADDSLKTVEQQLLTLEKNPDDREALAEARRHMHSFKGNCGLVNLDDLALLSHRTEEILEALLDESLSPDSQAVPIILSVIDVLQEAVDELADDGDGKITSVEVMVSILDEILPPEHASRPAEHVSPDIDTDAADKPQIKLDDNDDDAPPAFVAPKVNEVDQAATSERRRTTRQDIRVDLQKLDQLIDLVGELVIAETLVAENPDLEGYDFENFDKAALHLRKITRDLQDIAMSVRMIPVSGVFRKMIRLVHDLSNKMDKKIDLQLIGEDTEVDKTVAELLADPLVHIIRNAVDHGIETQIDRQKSGKPATGHVTLEARHEGGEVWVIIKDDGAGLDRAKILEKARHNGLITDDGSSLSDQQVFKILFEPGFSTAAQVTDVSGRGVGMDVVKKNVEKLKGHIDVYSTPGKGSTFILRIPLTLAIIDGMLIRVGQSCYTVPILAIRESLRPTPSQVTTGVDGQEVVNIRGQLLPVIRLHELHNRRPDSYELSEGLLVIVESHGSSVALFVDELVGQQQTVIKGLSSYMGDVRGVSGCAILGTGDVSLIIDLAGLAELARSRGDLNNELRSTAFKPISAVDERAEALLAD